MLFRCASAFSCALALLANGCAKCPPAAAPPQAAAAPGASLPASGPAEPGGASAGGGLVGSAAAPVSNEAAPPASPGERAGSLPEVEVDNVGLHVGGGANDEAGKAPYKRAIEPHFQDFRRCYVHVEEPGKGGTFGVDLFIGRDGGSPEVRQPRTGMKGQKFRDCMVESFKAIDFERPKLPTVISYSVRFRIGGQ